MNARVQRRGGRAVMGLLAAGLALVALPAHAVLGGDVSTVVADQARLHAHRRSAALAMAGANAPVLRHEITLADGSSIREFATAGGVVFAIAWSTRFKPDLSSLFGAQAPGYAVAASEALRAPGIRHQVELHHGDLVVRATAHLNAYVGVAWLQSRVPTGVGIDALR